MIRIKKSKSADTRSADHVIGRQELLDSTRMHISDVRKAMAWFSRMLVMRACSHDKTKLTEFDEFYRQFHNEQATGKGDWMDNPQGWYRKIHLVEERHHLNNACPNDVNLFDVIEMLCDCAMAGLARSGNYRHDDIDANVLKTAFDNTVKMLVENTIVED